VGSLSVGGIAWLVSSDKDFEVFLVGGCVGAAFGLLIQGGVKQIARNHNTWHLTTQRTALVSLRDQTNTEGSIFLFIEGKDYYGYFVGDSALGYHKEKIAADGIRIYEDQDSTGWLLEKRLVVDKPWRKWVLDGEGGSCAHYEFHVPKGTIVRQFKLE
jgi:hypothetical protein